MIGLDSSEANADTEIAKNKNKKTAAEFFMILIFHLSQSKFKDAEPVECECPKTIETILKENPLNWIRSKVCRILKELFAGLFN